MKKTILFLLPFLFVIILALAEAPTTHLEPTHPLAAVKITRKVVFL